MSCSKSDIFQVDSLDISSQISSARFSVTSSWGSSSYVTISINGVSQRRTFYQNGRDIWSRELVAEGIRDLINSFKAGYTASISIDDPTVVIFRTTELNSPLEVSFTKGTSNKLPGGLNLISDNNQDDSVIDTPILWAELPSLSSSQIYINARDITGDAENIFSIEKYE